MKLIILCTFIWIIGYVSSFEDIINKHKTVAHVSGKIVGGWDAERFQFPWMVSLKFSDTNSGWEGHNCGGVILNQDWVLSAAHCFALTGPGYYTVYAGKHNISRTEYHEQSRSVVITILHPDYNPLVIGPHDIALIRLSSPLIFDIAVSSILLPEPNTIPIGDASMAGWGSVSSTTTIEMPDILQTVAVSVLDYEICSEILQEYLFEESNLCSGPISGGISSCGGDSGSGLVQKNEEGNFELIGIIAWGFFPCAQVNEPTVYGRVSFYIDWINSNIL